MTRGGYGGQVVPVSGPLEAEVVNLDGRSWIRVRSTRTRDTVGYFDTPEAITEAGIDLARIHVKETP